MVLESLTMILSVLIFSLGSAAVTLFLLKQLCRPDSKLRILDKPNARSMHERPVPRTGGVAILAGIGFSVSLFSVLHSFPSFLLWIAIAVAVVSIISFMDDKNGVSPLMRLAGQIVGAGILVAGGLGWPPSTLPGIESEATSSVFVLVTLLYMVWMINLYNFMDGMDGLAATMAIIGFGIYAWFGWSNGDSWYFAFNSIISMAALGFLTFNYPPARIFMGDVGSATLGLLAAIMSILGVQLGLFPVSVALLVFSPFIADTTVTLVARAIRREKVWQAHKSHYYQKLVQAGFGQKSVLIIESGIMLSCAVLAVLISTSSIKVQYGTVLLVAIAYFGFFKWVAIKFKGSNATGTPT